MTKHKEKKETKIETRLQHCINIFSEKLSKIEKQGYNPYVKTNLKTLTDMRNGLYDAYHDPTCYDKNEIKHDILEFTKLIIRFNNVIQQHLNPKIKISSIDEQLHDLLKMDDNLKKIFQ